VSELGCDSFAGSLTVQLAETPAAPLTVLVTGYTVLDEGPFTLTAEFTPQLCGDGLVVGAEACDDGNEASGDGCSADCSAIEYDFYCDDAQTLPLDQTVSGELGGQSSLFSPSCGYGTGPDRLYRITAPQAGTLTVSLDQTVGANGFVDLALFALDGCGAPDSVSELGCSSVYDPAEQLVLEVEQNQTLFFVVDGQENTSGEYELSATLD
jgi:cysteine-rich repeat protein